jgi:transcriptional regulator with XRE-family HTH domain
MISYSASPERIAVPNLAERLIERMDTRGISVRQLADDADVNKDTIRCWRKGKVKSVRLDLAERVATALDTSAEHLLDLPANPRTGKARAAAGEIGSLVTRLEGLLTELNDAVREARRVSRKS